MCSKRGGILQHQTNFRYFLKRLDAYLRHVGPPASSVRPIVGKEGLLCVFFKTHDSEDLALLKFFSTLPYTCHMT